MFLVSGTQGGLNPVIFVICVFFHIFSVSNSVSVVVSLFFAAIYALTGLLTGLLTTKTCKNSGITEITELTRLRGQGIRNKD